MLLRYMSSGVWGLRSENACDLDLRFSPVSTRPRRSFGVEMEQVRKGKDETVFKLGQQLQVAASLTEHGSTECRKDDLPVRGLSDKIVGVLGGGQLGRMLWILEPDLREGHLKWMPLPYQVIRDMTVRQRPWWHWLMSLGKLFHLKKLHLLAAMLAATFVRLGRSFLASD